LAVFALPAPKAAETLLQLLPTLDRPLRAEEAALLGSQISNPAVLDAFRQILLQPARREGMLKSLLKLDASSARHPELVEIIGQAAKSLMESNPASFPLVLDLARQFRLKPLAPTMVARVKLEKEPAALANLLRTLNEMQAEEPALATTLLGALDWIVPLLLLALAQRLVATSFFELLLLLLFSPALGFLAPPLFLPALLLLQCVLGLLLIKRQRGKSRVDGFLPRRLNQCWLCRSRPHMRRLTWRPLPILSLLIGMLHQCCPLGVGNLG
jgi:hypothetical protein